MENPIIGYGWSNSEDVSCKPCGDRRRGNALTRRGQIVNGPQPIAIHANEMTWDDGIRCDDCGARLCGPSPAPKSFEQAWAARITRRTEAALARATSRS